MSRRWAAGLALLLAALVWPAMLGESAPAQSPLSALGLTVKDLPAEFVQREDRATPAYADYNVLLHERADHYLATFERQPRQGVIYVSEHLDLFQGPAQAAAMVTKTYFYWSRPDFAMTPTIPSVGDRHFDYVIGGSASAPCGASLIGVVAFSRGPYVASIEASDCMDTSHPSAAQFRRAAVLLMPHLVQWAKKIDGRMKKVRNPRVLDMYAPTPTPEPTSTPSPSYIVEGASFSFVPKTGLYQLLVDALPGSACSILVVFPDKHSEIVPS
jgi:hypothetical protein